MPSHYLNKCWFIVNLTLKNNFQWNFYQNIKLFIQENTSENIVCEMALILSRGDELMHCDLGTSYGVRHVGHSWVSLADWIPTSSFVWNFLFNQNPLQIMFGQYRSSVMFENIFSFLTNSSDWLNYRWKCDYLFGLISSESFSTNVITGPTNNNKT